MTIDPASINTDNEKRDGHLRTADFFDVEKCEERYASAFEKHGLPNLDLK